MTNVLTISLLFSTMIVLLVSTNVFAEDEEEWSEETTIDVSIVGDPVINLDSSNTLLRVYADITNFDPRDGYYFLRITQSATNTIISEGEIIVREKGNGKAGADGAHMISEDEIGYTGSLQGNYDVLVYTEYGTAIGNATFSIIKPSEPLPQTPSEIIATDEEPAETDEYSETESIEDESELINTKKIPDWVKNIFILYSYDEITENDLINALTYLIDQGIIEINQ